jgi:DNA-binding winged helix-turn-helix (wHTH) protein/TolB-like protein/tetratricopeptide (TPR) repeat protein
MATSLNVLYEFGAFQLDPPERLLRYDGQPVALTPKAFDLLLILVERSGHLIEKEELLRIVWRDSFVEEGNLAVTVSLLRKVLNDDRGQHRYIETVSKKGYRFVADVKRLDDHELLTADAGIPVQIAPEFTFKRPPVGHPGTLLLDRNLNLTRSMLLASLLIGLLMLIAINRYRAAASQPIDLGIRSLAVLPFETLGTYSQDNYLGIDIADAVITKLANTGKVIVRPTSAIQQYAGNRPTPQTVGREQRVDAVLEGRIQFDGSRVRVTVQLIRVKDGVQLWADNFDKRSTDIFALEDSVSEAAARSIRLQLTGEENRRFTKHSTENPSAYEAYARGRYFWNKRTESGLKKGLDYFREAIKLDPSFAEAYAGVADSYATLGLYAVLPPKEAFPAAKNAGTRALQMDNSLAAAHATLGFIYFYYGWNPSACANEFRSALEENPHYAMAHSWYAESLAAQGKYAEALGEAQRSLQDDPVSMIVATNAGWTYALAGQYDQALATLQKAIEIDPNFPRTHFRLGQVYEQRGQYAAAVHELEEAVRLEGDDWYYEGSLGHAYGASGAGSKALAIVEKLQARSARQYVPPYSIALVYAGLGERDQAFRWLQKAVEDRSTSMIFLRTDPELGGLRSDPRFVEISRLVNF